MRKNQHGMISVAWIWLISWMFGTWKSWKFLSRSKWYSNRSAVSCHAPSGKMRFKACSKQRALQRVMKSMPLQKWSWRAISAKSALPNPLISKIAKPLQHLQFWSDFFSMTSCAAYFFLASMARIFWSKGMRSTPIQVELSASQAAWHRDHLLTNQAA